MSEAMRSAASDSNTAGEARSAIALGCMKLPDQGRENGSNLEFFFREFRKDGQRRECCESRMMRTVKRKLVTRHPLEYKNLN